MADNKIQVLLEVDDKGTASLQKFGSSVERVSRSTTSAFGSMRKSADQFDFGVSKLKDSLGQLAAVYLGAQGARAILTIADTWTQLEGRLKLVTSSSAELAYVQERLYSSANTVRASYESHADLYARIARSMGGYNLSADQTIAFTEAVSRSMIVSGGTTQEASSFMVQFGQALASNRLQGEEFRAMLESNSRAVQVLTDYLGVDIETLREMAKSGELTADILYNAFSAASKKLAAEAESMPKTVAQAMEHLKNAGKLLVAETNKSSEATKSLAGTIDDLAVSVEDNREELVAMLSDMATGAINAAREAGKLVPVISSIYSASSQLLGLNAGEWGIIGFALLRGGPQAAALAGALLIINGALDELGLGLKSLGAAWKGYAESMQNMGDVLSGKRDAGTGAWIDQQSVKIGDLETKLANLQQQAASTGETFTTGFEVGVSAAADASDKLNAEIAETQAQLDIARGVSATFQKGIKSAVVDVNDLTIYTGELSLETGNLSGEMGTLESKTGAAGKASDGAAESKKGLAKASNTAAKAAKDLAAEQKRLADEAERAGRAEIEAAVKTREATAMLDKALFDTGDAYDTLGITSRKAYEDQVQAATDAYERILSIEDLTDSERARLREGLQKTLIELEDEYRGKAEETIGAIGIAWEDLTEDTKQVLHDWVEDAIKMEFDSVGEAFEGLAESILNVWIDLLAKMIAEWAISGIASLFGGGNLLGGLSSGLGGLLGGVPIIGDLFGKGGGTLADWGLTAAGTSSVIGGASSLLGGGAGSAAFDWGLNSFGAPALGGGAATGAATLFGEQAAAGFTASLDTAMAGGLEWAAIPGKEFFGTGASGAAGGGAGLSTGAMVGGGAIMGIGALIAMGMGGKAQQEFYSPRYGNVPFNDYGHDDRADMLRAGRSGYNWVSEAQPGSMSGSGDAGITQTVADLERAFTQFEQNTRIVLDVLAAAGDGVASLGQQLEDGTLSTDAFVDAIAGYDVSIQDTANLTSLASDAARGNGSAMDALRAALQSMGLGADQAEVAALSLVAASNNQSSALYAASSAASTASGAISGMVSNINTLSRTPLNIRVNVDVRKQPYRIDNSNPYAEHAVGGIFAGPTLIPSIRGTRHLVGEAGAEAITPLHAGPDTLKKMDAKLDTLLSGGRPVQHVINLDGRTIATATLPYVDAHVAAKATRGALTKRTVF